MARHKPGEDPEDDEFVDRLIEALSEEDWPTARTLGDQLAEVIGELDANPATLVDRTADDPGGSIAAQAHLSEWILILESRQDFQAAADIEVHLIGLFRRDMETMFSEADRGSAAFIEDAEAIVDQYEVRAIRFLAHMEDEVRAREAMEQSISSAREFGVPLDDGQLELAAEFGLS